MRHELHCVAIGTFQIISCTVYFAIGFLQRRPFAAGAASKPAVCATRRLLCSHRTFPLCMIHAHNALPTITESAESCLHRQFPMRQPTAQLLLHWALGSAFAVGAMVQKLLAPYLLSSASAISTKLHRGLGWFVAATGAGAAVSAGWLAYSGPALQGTAVFFIPWSTLWCVPASTQPPS
eukprot:SAG31_NODE_3175_length_4586_cov_4.176064_9_plen_179_part_00